MAERDGRKQIRLSEDEADKLTRYAHKMGVSQSRIGEQWLQELAEQGTDLQRPVGDRPVKLQVYSSGTLIALAEQAANEAGVTIQDVFIDRIARLNV